MNIASFAAAHSVIPAQAGIHFEFKKLENTKVKSHWIPAFAGMTVEQIVIASF